MSAMTSLPASASAGGSTSGSFGARQRHRERRVRPPARARRGLSADRPLGRSIDDDRPARDAFRSATIVSASPVSGALSPVPNSASTMTSDAEHVRAVQLPRGRVARSRRRRRPRSRSTSRFARASPFDVGRRADEVHADVDVAARAACARRRSRRRRCCRARRARRRASTASAVERATPSPRRPAGRRSPSARSTAMPMSSIVRRSASRICSALSTRMRVTYSASSRAYPLC